MKSTLTLPHAITLHGADRCKIIYHYYQVMIPALTHSFQLRKMGEIMAFDDN